MESSGATGTGARPPAPADDRRTRDRVTALLVEHGPQTASELAGHLGISAAAVRRHLDALTADARVEERLSREAHRRGRPARRFHLTDAGRAAFPHAYDDLALTALRYVAATSGPEAVREVAERQLAGLEERCSTAVAEAARRTGAPVDRARALAVALTAEGYAASASVIAGGGQLCQHHCPVAHVAAEFPQLCEAETAVISRLVGTHVQRLATIAHGDGICTTHIPGPVHIPAPLRPRQEAPPAGSRRERSEWRGAGGVPSRGEGDEVLSHAREGNGARPERPVPSSTEATARERTPV